MSQKILSRSKFKPVEDERGKLTRAQEKFRIERLGALNDRRVRALANSNTEERATELREIAMRYQEGMVMTAAQVFKEI